VRTKKGKREDFKKAVSDWEIYGIPVFGGGEVEVLKKAEQWLSRGEKGKWIATVNPEFVMRAIGDDNFMGLLAKTDMNVVDGIGLIWAKKVKAMPAGRQVSKSKSLKVLKKIFYGVKVGGEILRGKYRDELAAGADLMIKMACLKVQKSESLKVFFLGGWGDRAERTAKQLSITNYELRIGWSSGGPKVKNEEVIRQINKFKPDLLFVAYGMQKQEEWIYKNIKDLDVGVAMGVGRSFDYYSGDLKRAPGWVRRMGMEWLYSLIVEPKRWKRQLVLPQFVWKVIIN
jgi:N-acetylglucosaminyldiphosphoundecaprenol N-acetyl-beta-D-mannosaminyltransferase